MAWEWIGTSVVGVAGIWGTWLTGKQSRDQAERTNRSQLDQARLLAREARKQERLETAYLELLTMVERASHWAQLVLPLFDTVPSSMPGTKLPELEDQAQTAALVNAFGSDAVREKWEAWESVLKNMIRLVEVIQYQDANPPLAPAPRGQEPRTLLDAARTKEKEARKALADQVAAELRGG